MFTNGLRNDETVNMIKALEEFKAASDAFSKKHNISAHTGVNAAIGLDSSKTLIGGAAEKLFGVNGKVDLNGNAINQEAMDKAMDSQEGKRLQASIQKVDALARSRNLQLSDSSGQDALHNLSGNIERAKSSADNFNTSYTKYQNWEKVQSYAQTKGLSISSNENDAWTDFVSQRTGRSKADVPDYLSDSTHSNEVSKLQSEFVDHRKEQLRSFVDGTDHVLSDREIQNWHSKTPMLNPTGEEFLEPLRTDIAEQNFVRDDQLRGAFDTMEKGVTQKIGSVDEIHDHASDVLSHRKVTYENRHAQQHKMLNDDRLGSKMYRDTMNKPSQGAGDSPINDMLPRKG